MRQSRDPDTIYEALYDVACHAASVSLYLDTKPEQVSERSWSQSRFPLLPDHGALPQGHEFTRQLTAVTGIKKS